MPPLAVILKVMKREFIQHHRIFGGVWRLMEKFSSPTLPGSPGALDQASRIPSNNRASLSPISADLILAAECFQEAMITEELCPASIKKYLSSMKSFFSIIGHKNFRDLTNGDFDDYILKMKEKGAGNSRIAHVISAIKWLLARLQKKGC